MMTSPVSTSVGTIQRTIPLDDSSDLLFGTFLGATDWDFVNAIAVDASGNSFVAGGSLSTNFPTTPGALFPYSPSFYGRWSAFAAKLNPTGTELVYASYLGGRWDDFSSAIAIDSLGNAYLTGQTKSPDFPVTPQAFDTSYNHTYPCRNDPCSDAFVTKLNPHGTALIFSTYLGSTGEDSIGDVVAHSSGDVYVVGSTTGVDFPTTPGAFDRTFNGGLYDSYLVKLDATGSILDYGTFIGGSDWDGSGAIFVDTMGNAYLTGSTTSSDYPTTSSLSAPPTMEAFMTALSRR